MTIYNEEVPIRIEADEGKILTNNEIYAKTIYLGKFDSPANWHEVDESEADEEPINNE